MAKFELNYAHSIEYDNKIELQVRLQERPCKEDYQEMLTAIATLDKLSNKYLPTNKDEGEK